MANQRDPIYKYYSIKVDVNIKKSNRVKSRGRGKSDINEKNIKEDRQQLIELT